MDNYTTPYLRNHCVDFFFVVRNIPIHVLTDGCLIPKSLIDVMQNRKLQHTFAIMEDSVVSQGYVVNQDYINFVQQKVRNIGEEYLEYIPTEEQLIESHAQLSRLGFYSYACVWDNVEETQCHFMLVTSPNEAHQYIECELPVCSEQEIRLSEDLKEFIWDPYLNI